MSEIVMETVCRVCDHRKQRHTGIGECWSCGGDYCDGFDENGDPRPDLWVTREVVLPKCDRDDCAEPVEAYGRRFCTPHRKEHGRSLLVQLEALTMGRDRWTCDQCGREIRGASVKMSPIERVHLGCKAAWDADMAAEYAPVP